MAITDEEKSDKAHQQYLEREGLREAQQKALAERDRLARSRRTSTSISEATGSGSSSSSSLRKGVE